MVPLIPVAAVERLVIIIAIKTTRQIGPEIFDAPATEFIDRTKRPVTTSSYGLIAIHIIVAFLICVIIAITSEPILEDRIRVHLVIQEAANSCCI